MVRYGGSVAFAIRRELSFNVANLKAVATSKFRNDGRQKDIKLRSWMI